MWKISSIAPGWFVRDLQACGQGAQWGGEAVVSWCPVPSLGLCSLLVRVLRTGSLGRCSAVLLCLVFAVSVMLGFLSVATVPHCRFVLHPLALQTGLWGQQVVTGTHGNCETPNHKASLRGVHPWALVALLQSLNFGTVSSVCGAWQQCRVVRKCHGKRLGNEHVFLGVLVHSASPGNSLCQLQIICK